ncbi:hypothetical protein J437_LFUL014605 [Ladona fulva]|uniref:tRNA/rRNA methyltransferase SpoU type domain-containing protein n=1 Tax=Ladona fulva TaxID=123851 RepID=A0A8K0P3G8_LADFU|nr:hypothetical protein J437_LFUL014605 [Ladona fulva]
MLSSIKTMSLISVSCRRCMLLGKYCGPLEIYYNRKIPLYGVRYAGNLSKNTVNENMPLQGSNVKVFVKFFTNLSNMKGQLTETDLDPELCDGNNASEDSDGENVPPYIKLQDNDKTLGKAMVAVHSKRNKINRTEILLEGTRLISEAIKHGLVPKQVYFSRFVDVKKIPWPTIDFKMYKVPYRTIKLWSSLKTSPGVLAIFELPAMESKDENFNSIPLIIVCDNIRDPGNLGSILRVAAGVGCHSVLLTKGCVDLWDPKVLRSGAGAHFVLPVHQNCTWEKIRDYMHTESPVVLADSQVSSKKSSNSVPLHQYHLVDYCDAWKTSSPIILVLGGETEGLSKEACELAESCDGIRVHIPLSNDIESLNTATALGVISFEIKRQYHKWTEVDEPLLKETG